MEKCGQKLCSASDKWDYDQAMLLSGLAPIDIDFGALCFLNWFDLFWPGIGPTIFWVGTGRLCTTVRSSRYFELLHPMNNPFKLFKFYCNTAKTPNGGYSHNDCMTPTLLTKCNAQREHGQGITEGKQVWNKYRSVVMVQWLIIRQVDIPPFPWVLIKHWKVSMRLLSRQKDPNIPDPRLQLGTEYCVK